MTENKKLRTLQLNEDELRGVSGGEGENTIHPVFMWQCSDCTTYLGKTYDDVVCSKCGSKNLHYVRIM